MPVPVSATQQNVFARPETLLAELQAFGGGHVAVRIVSVPPSGMRRAH